MVMSPSEAVDLVKLYVPVWKKNRDEIDRVDRWYRGRLDLRDMPYMPKKPTSEYKELRARAITPWLRFVVRSLTQSLYVEGYRHSGEQDNAAAWNIWQANGLDARQIAVHRGAIAHALSYVKILPGDPVPVLRGVSARRMVAFYQDVSVDDWPMYALEGEQVIGARGPYWAFKFYDDTDMHVVHAQDLSGGGIEWVDYEVHDAGECPVVRFANEIDLDGRADGEVEPYINMAARIDQDTFDRLVVQRFGAWLVRYIAGLAKPETDEEKRAQRLMMSVEDLLMAEDPDTKFGAIPATPLDGYIKAHDADLRDLAVITQTPPQDMLGQMINISAEALAAAESGKTHKLEERKHGFGESWEQSLRMGAHLQGDETGAADFAAEVSWRDMESRSLAQAADALGKLATQLGIPAQVLWSKVPGLTQQDIEEAKAITEKNGGVAALMQHLLAQRTAPAAPPAG